MRALATAPSAARQATLEMVHYKVLRGLGFENADPSTNRQLPAAKSVLAAVTGRSAVVAEVGANPGDYTALLTEGSDATFDVHCFEASARASADQAERFADRSPVHVHNVGLSDRDASGLLDADSLGSTCASLCERVVFRTSEAEEVRLRRLSDVCGELGITSIDLLKVDAEGHDIAVLHGAGRMLAEGRIGAIQFEPGGTAPDARMFLRDFFDLLQETHRIHRILPDDPWPLDRYTEEKQIGLYANYFAPPRTA
jgi:FkbM family methyltransferase